MFGKRECQRCREKSSNKYNFCPNCGVPFNNKSGEDYGMLGENDSNNFPDFNNLSNPFLGGINGKMMGKMFESAVRMLEKEMKKQNSPKTNFQLFINGKKVNIEKNLNNSTQSTKRYKREMSSENLPQANLKKFGDFPKKEPETNVRRFSDKVIYEINMPGLKSEKEISIIKLENSIEIKALGNDVIYRKIIPISLPITDYKISNDKLVLELGLKE
ncbi:MAG: hypothetical protein AABX84_01060 [Nanoarchaeota archaeon]